MEIETEQRASGRRSDTQLKDISIASAMFVAASSLQNARSMHGVNGTAMHGNALRMFLQITVRCPHLLQDNFLAGLHSCSNRGYSGSSQ